MKLYTVAQVEDVVNNDINVEIGYDADTKSLVGATIFSSPEDAEEYIHLYEEYRGGGDSGLAVVEMEVRFGFAKDHYKQALANGETWATRTLRRRSRQS